MVERKTWAEFQDVKLLWWVNRILHTFGWAIVYESDECGNLIDVFPARVDFRGFDGASESEGFKGVTKYLQANVDELLAEARE